jgi:hypothetical protein
MSRVIKVTHKDVEYEGFIASIIATHLGFEDHGVLTVYLELRWHIEGTAEGMNVGGYILDAPRDREAGDYTRSGTAFGLDHIIRILETVGVRKWESLEGETVIVLFKHADRLGQPSGIASILKEDAVLIFKEHSASFKGAQ